MRLAWGRHAETLQEETRETEATPYELSAIDVYTLDGRQVAWIATNGDRASDMLNRDGEIPLHGLTAVNPADESVSFASVPAGEDDATPLDRGKVRFIVPPPLPANRHLRLHRRRILIALRMGPYEVNGQVHVRPGADASDYLLRSGRGFVPLTDVELVHREEPQWRRYLPVLILNVTHVTELINMERRERSMAATVPTVAPVKSPAPRPVPRGPVLSRIAAQAPDAVPPELLKALQLLLDHGLINTLEFQQKRAALSQRV